ncbi:MAG: TAXI family TRAP transporter solute-binding subunit [Magnetococcales bacterium]|nr:TAXI family TRAP transporter solute-binding subunit [Magnetococcales bacterium]
MRIFRMGAVAALVLLSSCSSGEENKNTGEGTIIDRIRVGSGGLEGKLHRAGTSICQTLAKEKETATIPCETLVSDGSTHNLLALQEGKIELGLARADVVYRAWHGQPPFQKGFSNLRVLFSLHQEVVTLIIPRDAAISTFRGIEGKKIHVGVAEPDNERVVLDVLKSCNLSTSDLTLVDDGKLTQLSSGMKNHAVQAYFSLASHPDEALTRLSLEHSLAILPLTEPCIEKMVDERSYYDKSEVPGELYRGVKAPVPSFGIRLLVLTTIDVSEKAAYRIVKGIFDHIEELRQSNPLFHRLSPKVMLPQFSVPYHNGALRYFSEKGWFQPEGK